MSFLFLSKVLRHTFHWFFASECLSRVLGLFWTQFWNAMKCHSGCHSTGFTSPTPFVFSLSTDYWITRTFHKKEKRRKKKRKKKKDRFISQIFCLLRQKIWEINLSFLLFFFFFFFSSLFFSCERFCITLFTDSLLPNASGGSWVYSQPFVILWCVSVVVTVLFSLSK